ncbi:hypothetical protein PENSPDRAFT_648117 [Peniophora sp. CONT]|nr:hypothetical protein PENSPDRAFT_648117 [Peniophora sp. CONT]
MRAQERFSPPSTMDGCAPLRLCRQAPLRACVYENCLHQLGHGFCNEYTGLPPAQITFPTRLVDLEPAMFVILGVIYCSACMRRSRYGIWITLNTCSLERL